MERARWAIITGESWSQAAGGGGPSGSGTRSRPPWRRFVRVVIGVATLVGLGGCAGVPATPGNAPTTTAAGTTTAASTTAPADQEPTASQVALLYMDAFRGDLTGLQAYNPGTSASGDSFAGINRATLKALGVTLTEEQQSLVTDATRTGVSKVETTVVKEQMDGSTATVTLAIRGIDLLASYKQHVAAIDQTKLTPANRPGTYATALAASWEEAPLVEKASTVDLVLTYPPGVTSGGKWIPDAASGKAIASAFVKTS